jgi:hypothetical protein
VLVAGDAGANDQAVQARADFVVRDLAEAARLIAVEYPRLATAIRRVLTHLTEAEELVVSPGIGSDLDLVVGVARREARAAGLAVSTSAPVGGRGAGGDVARAAGVAFASAPGCEPSRRSTIRVQLASSGEAAAVQGLVVSRRDAVAGAQP